MDIMCCICINGYIGTSPANCLVAYSLKSESATVVLKAADIITRRSLPQ